MKRHCRLVNIEKKKEMTTLQEGRKKQHFISISIRKRKIN
jgi:hypothetical protein